ncbi:poly(R)-hydroxyalkanoic acid synthase subunit PhaE [Pinirhizobacter soli]|uniref:poly(R)-hydroxyalkanoic acid synthase subunit PhaE n=1 Tax=Pinirhizobacter soli TaxID=2786953 RepID=UPI00202A2B9B|nr:poly(R)-hydroxyalkanoic acid synthase subunit PhaE [Pinirhizobacter soli]
MTRPAPDFLDAYQSLLRDGWETWLRQVDPKATPGMDEKAAVARMLEGIDDYTRWLQSNIASAAKAAPDVPAWTPPPAFGRLSGDDVQQRFQAWVHATREWLGDAAAGPNAATHADQQALFEALADLAAKQQRYQALLGQVQARGLASLQQRMAGKGKSDVPTMRSLYDTWVEVAEEAYNDAALSKEFRETYGALANAQVRVRTMQQDLFARVGEQMGMPGRGDIDALSRSIQDMRREIASLRAQVAAVTPGVKPASPSAKKSAAQMKLAPKAASAKKKATRKTGAASPSKTKSGKTPLASKAGR